MVVHLVNSVLEMNEKSFHLIHLFYFLKSVLRKTAEDLGLAPYLSISPSAGPLLISTLVNIVLKVLDVPIDTGLPSLGQGHLVRQEEGHGLWSRWAG